MNKFFEKLSEKFKDAAFEAKGGDFVCEFDAIDIPAEIEVSVKSRTFVNINGRRVSCSYYDVDKISIFDEYGDDVSGNYPRFCERVKDCLPSYKDIEESLEESNMSEMELYFGSEANYLKYKYGN